MAKADSSLAFLLICACLIPGIAYPEVYKWVDGQGRIHYGDHPPAAATTQEVDVQPPIPSEKTDPGELRRRRLLEQTERDVNRRLEQRQIAKQQRRLRREELAAEEDRCQEARMQLEVLQAQLPVYRDADGKLRVRWAKDAYQGPRDYLDDRQRAAEVRRVRKAIAQRCRHADDADAQDWARWEKIRQDRCEAATDDLRMLERPQSRVTVSDLKQQRELVKELCRD